MRRMNALVGMTRRGGPKVATPEAMGVEFLPERVMLLALEIQVIPIPPPTVMTPTNPRPIRAKF